MNAIDHRQAIAAIPDDIRRHLIEKSDGPGLVHAAVHLGLIGGLVHGLKHLFLFPQLNLYTNVAASRSLNMR